MSDEMNHKATAKMRYCWNCGGELGVIERRHYDPRDTCGSRECERAARDADAAERDEAHRHLDEDRGWWPCPMTLIGNDDITMSGR